MRYRKRTWRQKGEQLLKEARLSYFVSRHPRTRWYVKLVAGSSVAYVFSPVQLIPSFIPVIGFLDDFVVLFIGAKLVRKFTPPDLLRECRKLADASAVDNEVRPGVDNRAAFPVAAWLLLAAIAASALIFVHFFHFW